MQKRSVLGSELILSQQHALERLQLTGHCQILLREIRIDLTLLDSVNVIWEVALVWAQVTAYLTLEQRLGLDLCVLHLRRRALPEGLKQILPQQLVWRLLLVR